MTVPCRRRVQSASAQINHISQDDFDRENEGDLILSAERMTTERMAFMVSNSQKMRQDLLLPSGRHNDALAGQVRLCSIC